MALRGCVAWPQAKAEAARLRRRSAEAERHRAVQRKQAKVGPSGACQCAPTSAAACLAASACRFVRNAQHLAALDRSRVLWATIRASDARHSPAFAWELGLPYRQDSCREGGLRGRVCLRSAHYLNNCNQGWPARGCSPAAGGPSKNTGTTCQVALSAPGAVSGGPALPSTAASTCLRGLHCACARARPLRCSRFLSHP